MEYDDFDDNVPLEVNHESGRIDPDSVPLDDGQDEDVPYNFMHGLKEGARNVITAPPQLAKYQVQPFVPVRSEKHVMDSVCYYQQQALITLVYASKTQGHRIPGLMDEATQRFPTGEIAFKPM